MYFVSLKELQMDLLGIPLSVFLLWKRTLQGVLEPDLPVLQIFPIGGAFHPAGSGGWVQPSLPIGLNSVREGGSAWL